MLIRTEQDLSVDGIEIIIKYAEPNIDVERITALLQSMDARIKCSFDGRDKFVSIMDIFYFESVDKMTFVYCEKDVYKTDLRLYQIVEDFAHMGFVQISKACVLNIHVLDSIAPIMNSKMEATLKNTERILVTRRYLENIRQALKGGM